MFNAHTADSDMTPGEREMKVWVRKGARPDQRSISFEVLPEMNQMELIDNSYAIDGNRAIRYVNMDVESLVDVQKDLATYLRAYGRRALFV